jgi:hypothetical protein
MRQSSCWREQSSRTWAKEKRTQAETTAINQLKAAKDNVDRKPPDLKTAHEGHVARAKSDIDAEVAKFKASIDELGAKYKTAKK